MSIRAVILGLLLGLGVSAFTFFNDNVIRQTSFVSNQLPISVFGAAVLVLLAVNPLLRLIGATQPLRTGEVLVAVAIGLAACGWPGFNFFRGFVPTTALPAHWAKANPSWQAVNAMSYIPGGSPALAAGHVQDWPALLDAFHDAGAGRSHPFLAQLLDSMPGTDRQAVLTATPPLSATLERQLLTAINGALANPDFVPGHASSGAASILMMNRRLLAEALPGAILPPPEGRGALLADGWAGSPAVDALILGNAGRPLALADLPWSEWRPTLRLWGTVALLLAVAALCLTLIIHPQWSRRELLPYPIARFAAELAARDPDHTLPNVARRPWFWYAAAAVFAIHAVNGLHAWFPAVPVIPLDLRLSGLRPLFPDAGRVYGSDHVFQPHLYLTVIAFAFFLSRSVSFTLGISQFAFMALGAALIAAAVPIEKDYIGANNGNNLRFGAYAGMALMIAYIGRHYYARVALGAAGLPRGDCPAASVWAARGLALSFALTVLALRTAGLDAFIASCFVLLVLVTFVVFTRIIAETGLLFVQAWWMPVGALTALFGIEALGPTSYILLAIASLVLVGDPRTALMPYLANGLAMTDRADAATPARLAPWLLAMIVAGFLVSGLATFHLLYTHGIDQSDSWAVKTAPSLPFDHLTRHVSTMEAQDTLARATGLTAWERLGAIRPMPGAMPWMIAGASAVVATQLARLRFPLWPLHPVLFLIWGTSSSSVFGVSFLLGWAIKAAVTHTLGARGYRLALPIMVGVIAGELTAALFWIAVGAACYFTTNSIPAAYAVFP